MRPPDAVLTAVLRTLLRATVDGRVTVVLRGGRPAQAQALARWLTRAHGSRRDVIASDTVPGGVEVHLPPRVVWPAAPATGAGLARSPTGHHFSGMNLHAPADGER